MRKPRNGFLESERKAILTFKSLEEDRGPGRRISRYCSGARGRIAIAGVMRRILRIPGSTADTAVRTAMTAPAARVDAKS